MTRRKGRREKGEKKRTGRIRNEGEGRESESDKGEGGKLGHRRA